MKKLNVYLVLLVLCASSSSFAQNSYPASGPAIIATGVSGDDRALIIKDTRSGLNWNYIEWQFNDGNRDWVMGRQITTGNFTVYRQNVGEVFSINGVGNTWIKGNLGLGVTPYEHSTLHIKSPSAYPWGFIVEASANRRNIAVGHDGTYGMISTATLDGTGFSPLQLRTSATARVTIDVNGKVGIGTTTPASQLEIAGPATGTGATVHASGGGDVLLNPGGSLFLDGNYSYASGNYLRPSGGANTQGFFTAGLERIRINSNGKVGIGTPSPDELLTVNGKIHSEEVIIEVVNAPDYVFQESYDLKSLDEVKQYIDQNNHLPEVPSAKQMEKDGVKVGEMEMILLKKIEEMTLYLIELKKDNTALHEKVSSLEAILSESKNKK